MPATLKKKRSGRGIDLLRIVAIGYLYAAGRSRALRFLDGRDWDGTPAAGPGRMMEHLLGQIPPRTCGRLPRLPSRSRGPCRLLALCLVLSVGGCAGIHVKESRLRSFIEDRHERSAAGQELDGSSGALLSRHGLLEQAADDPAGAAQALAPRLEQRPEPEGALALAELSYRAGLEQERAAPEGAIAWYRDTAVLAALALEDASAAQTERAIDLHNRGVARLIRIAQAGGERDGESWRRVLGEQGMAVGGSEPFLDPLRFADLRVARDLKVSGMYHVYRAEGLGVPVVARRVVGEGGDPDPRDQFLPREIRTAATAVVIPAGPLEKGAWRGGPTTLLFSDPFDGPSIAIGGREVPLAGDRTTPLAVQIARGPLAALEWTGLFDSDFGRPNLQANLYMVRPYEPGKIPVILVHGLYSSPRAFAQTVNELGNTPAISSRYQFWVFLYPTGLPIPASAAKLRQAITKVRDTIDPTHADSALDQMVLVGHSMGGLLSKMMAQESGMMLWDSTIRIPYDQFKFSPELRETLGNALVYHPVPSVRRVVFIASPHRGSPLADNLFGRTVTKFLRRPDALAASTSEVEALNGPNVLVPEMRGRTPNAIANLRTDSPILAALNQIPIDPKVPYHSIIPQIFGEPGGTDGVVQYTSSHVDGAVSEQVVTGTHSAQQKPAVTDELRRILLEHLASVDGTVRR